MGSAKINLYKIHDLVDRGVKTVKLKADLVGRHLKQNDRSKFWLDPAQESNSHIRSNGIEEYRWPHVSNILDSGAGAVNQQQFQIDDSSLCSTSSICPAPLNRQFWKAGDYDDRLNSKPTYRNGTSHLRIHPKFLHSNATSHKWVFGAVAELIDNSVDEIQSGATFVMVDKTSNPRDGSTMLLVQDDGCGMDPEAVRRCISFGFSDKKLETTIGQYGNGFKTSSMRLGADVIVFSRRVKNRNLTQSVGLLSFTFLMQTGQDRIVVPLVDYHFNSQSGTWNTLHNEQQFERNLSILLKWSPFCTEAELLKQFDDIGHHGTKIMVYNLWQNDEGEMELDFESDPEDICISGKDIKTMKVNSRMAANENHLANRLQYSLRAYLSILYLRVPDSFCIILRGRVVEYHSIANDLKFPEFILYRPQNVEGSVITAIGFLKEAPAVNLHGFNIYHRNRLILPFWRVVSNSNCRGRGVVGVLEANFIQPTHNKQEFEKTQAFQKLESRLKDMTHEYWDYHCGLIGYRATKAPRAMTASCADDCRQSHGIYQAFLLNRDSLIAGTAKMPTSGGGTEHEQCASPNQVAAKSATSKFSNGRDSQGQSLKRKGYDCIVEHEQMKKRGGIGSRATDAAGGDVQCASDPAYQLEDQEAANIIQENRKLRVRCQEYENSQEELALKVTRLKEEIREAQREYACLLLESKLLEKVKRESKAAT